MGGGKQNVLPERHEHRMKTNRNSLSPRVKATRHDADLQSLLVLGATHPGFFQSDPLGSILLMHRLPGKIPKHVRVTP